MGFGTELWDQVRTVESYVEYNIASMDKVNEFMKTVAAAEAEYSKTLLKIIKQYKEEFIKRTNEKTNLAFNRTVLNSSFSRSWMFLLTETEGLVEAHQSVAAALDTDLRKTVKYKARDNEKLAKQHFEEIKKSGADLKKAVDHLEKLQQKYEKATKDMDNARIAFENANKDMNTTKKDIEKLRVDAEKKAVAAQEATVAYKNCIGETNILKNRHFKETLPTILDQIQKEDEENRVTFTKSALMRYATLFSTTMPKMDRAYKDMIRSFDTIDAAADSELFITTLKTNETHPPDFQMADISESPTSATTGGRILGFMKSSPTKASKEEESVEDTIVALPGKQGRRKAVDRIKVLEKEIAELEKKKHGVSSLITVYHEKQSSDPKIQQDLEDQKANFDKKIDSLQAKKQKLQAYIQDVDGGSTSSHATNNLEQPGSSVSPDRNLSISSSNLASPSNLPSLGSIFSSHDKDLSKGGDSTPVYNTFSGSLELPPLPRMPVIGRVKMLFDFDAAPKSEELPAKEGEVLDVLVKQEDGWWRVRKVQNGQEGYVPGNYTTPC